MRRKSPVTTSSLSTLLEPPNLELLRGIILDGRVPTEEELIWIRKHLGLALSSIAAAEHPEQPNSTEMRASEASMEADPHCPPLADSVVAQS